ncbi:MAG: Crp/Fnr family transcriptional regulator [Hydrococcus sp. C42_A2020_068]|uniref:Crp/Fnr family transcriptional regulator n=1 Tax=Pleurocapsa sp. PCC 7327 TaxID=118163 RepID=UPI00029FC48F|nr:Crp/Fnr family transcriptional regulator [Pleurocapsa sp. PCC 7327]AFY76002.1 cAMP-binding protein [Pleurocapsa sp. PCC 7327]MBF2021873.1 Crp/Fnr family transcriptional regulator [Hydrococcus sp. C42_A2020_068]
METKAIGELFPLFIGASPETLERLVSVAQEQDYSKDSAVITESAWGKAVFFIVCGWVKIRSLYGNREVTLEILSRGNCFGEMAVLDESPRATEAIALSDVQLLSISAQRFLQILLKDPTLHHRMLQLMAHKMRQFYYRFQLYRHPPRFKLIKTLIFLAENYGQPTEKGTKILNIPHQDLADLAGINFEETSRLLNKLQDRGWLEIELSDRALYLTNIKQLYHLAKQL